MRINDTADYHRYDLRSLGWELTMSNALSSPASPCRRLLKKDDSYGGHLYAFLDRRLSCERFSHVVEIGGGYGYLMRDFIALRPSLKVTMVDISPRLLDRQREALRGYDVRFVEGDFLETDPGILAGADLVIMNENLGDFPTLLDLTYEDMAGDGNGAAEAVRRARDLIRRYRLDYPSEGTFAFNLGAAQAVEKVCSAAVPVVFICEHSCEAKVPEDLRRLINLPSPGLPERICLKGHDEYTLKFSHLEKIARFYAYGVFRGPLADILTPRLDGRLKALWTVGANLSDEGELLRFFAEDLYRYEYLLLVGGGIKGGETEIPKG